jgi:hypothetical protein
MMFILYSISSAHPAFAKKAISRDLMTAVPLTVRTYQMLYFNLQEKVVHVWMAMNGMGWIRVGSIAQQLVTQQAVML